MDTTIVVNGSGPVKDQRGHPPTLDALNVVADRVRQQRDPDRQLDRFRQQEARDDAKGRPPHKRTRTPELDDRPLRRQSAATLQAAKAGARTILDTVAEEEGRRRAQPDRLMAWEAFALQTWALRWVAPSLQGADLAVFLVVLDRTFGWRKLSELIPPAHLTHGVAARQTCYRPGLGYSNRAVRKALDSLTARGAIIRQGYCVMVNLPLDMLREILTKHPHLHSLVDRAALARLDAACTDPELVGIYREGVCWTEVSLEALIDRWPSVAEDLRPFLEVIDDWELSGFDLPLPADLLRLHIACTVAKVPRPWVPSLESR